MPHRVVAKAIGRVLDHVHEHPWRLVATLVILLGVSFSVLAWSFVRTLDDARQGRVENCRALNELYVKLYIAGTDLGWPASTRSMFIPSQNCEDLP